MQLLKQTLGQAKTYSNYRKMILKWIYMYTVNINVNDD